MSNNFTSSPQTEEDLADTLGLTRQTLQNYKSLANAIPEIQTLVETGIVTPTTARAIMKKLPEFQQKELAEQFAEKGEKYSPKIKKGLTPRRDTQRKPLKKKIRQKKTNEG